MLALEAFPGAWILDAWNFFPLQLLAKVGKTIVRAAHVSSAGTLCLTSLASLPGFASTRSF
jgi:hypothetical protein